MKLGHFNHTKVSKSNTTTLLLLYINVSLPLSLSLSLRVTFLHKYLLYYFTTTALIYPKVSELY